MGLDSRITETPDWLADWTMTDMTLTDNGNPIVTYNVYKKNYAAGSKIILGRIGNGSVVNYVVMAKEQEQQIEFISGDINDDKCVDIFDMILMRKAVVAPLTDEREKLAADVDNNGKIEIADAVMLQNFLLGRIKAFK